ncbi:small multi-drug export protein [Candidatus Pacearchaeota archaeon]|nr:small multi-drug export protein [Candidatus Pacearchaeota archaeon]
MALKLLYAILLTLLPVFELRVGLPLAMLYAQENGVSLILVFLLIVLINILLIFIIFFFLDHIHKWLMNFKFYEKFFKASLKRFQKRVDKFEKRHAALGFIALTLLIAVPLPGTGAWSGSLVAWILGLDRRKSILSIALGVLIAGLLIFLGMFGFISFFL